MFFVTHLTQNLPARFDKGVSILFKILDYLLAVVLAFSGIAKLIDASALLQTLQQVTFLSEGMDIFIAAILPIVELGLSAALFLKWKLQVTLAATSVLFTGFLGFAIYGTYIGMTGDCGCFGGTVESSFGWGMVIRNGMLTSLSVAALATYYKHLRKQD